MVRLNVSDTELGNVIQLPFLRHELDPTIVVAYKIGTAKKDAARKTKSGANW
jgi:hypothetical protein